jgi:hypothetical protein
LLSETVKDNVSLTNFTGAIIPGCEPHAEKSCWHWTQKWSPLPEVDVAFYDTPFSGVIERVTLVPVKTSHLWIWIAAFVNHAQRAMHKIHERASRRSRGLRCPFGKTNLIQ